MFVEDLKRTSYPQKWKCLPKNVQVD